MLRLSLVIGAILFLLGASLCAEDSIKNELHQAAKIENSMKGSTHKVVGGNKFYTVTGIEGEKAKGRKAASLLGIISGADLQKAQAKAKEVAELKNANQVKIKILLTLFYNKSKNIKADKLLFYKLKKLLEENGYVVSDEELSRKLAWNRNVSNLNLLSNKELASLAKKNGYNYIIVGEIQKYKGTKDFRMGNFLLLPPGMGMVLYGEMKFNLKVVDSEGKEVYQKKFYLKKKNQIFGFYQGKGAVLDRIFKVIGYELIDELKPLLN